MDNNTKRKYDNDGQSAHCTDNFIKSCVLANSLYEFDREWSREEQMKRDIRAKKIRVENYPNIEARLDIRHKQMESTRIEMSYKLKALEKDIVDQAVDKIYLAADTSRKLEQITLPTQNDLMEIVYKDDHLENEIVAAANKADFLKESKVDKSQMSRFRTAVNNADQYLQEYILTTTQDTSKELDLKFTTTADIVKDSFPKSSVNVDILAADTMNKIMQTSSRKASNHSQNSDLSKDVKEALDDYLGSELIDAILNPSSSIYPTTANTATAPSAKDDSKLRKHCQQRLKIKASVSKMTKMEKEADESIALFEKNTNSASIQDMYRNLEFIDTVLKNHQNILEFMNDPEGKHKVTEVASVPLGSRRLIPNTINLNEVNNALSSALATAVVGYTQEVYFTELSERLTKLEERTQ